MPTIPNTNVKLARQDMCTGCTACVFVCPTSSISMLENKEGFLQPFIDVNTCNACHRCEEYCPVLHPPTIPSGAKVNVYVANNNDDSIRVQSSSGGIFHSIAKWIIEQGGVVFGARFNDKWEVVHDYCETEDVIQLFMRSKYVQSNVGSTFIQAKQFLQGGRWVLYTGTPCQIEGLKSYLKDEYDRLLTIDFICHGVPSLGIWRKFLSEFPPKKYSITNIDFRDKCNGWHKLTTRINSIDVESNDEKCLRCSAYDFPYTIGFYQNYYLRRVCYRCPFKTVHRNSDITLADAWGIESFAPELDDDKGSSLVFVHTDKGRRSFHGSFGTIITKEISVSEALYKNKYMYRSVKHTIFRELFYTLNRFFSVTKCIRIIRFFRIEKNNLKLY